MNKKITLLVFAFTCLLNGIAQFDLQGTQKFNWPKANIPYIGMDYLRLFTPKITVQRRTGFNSMNMTYVWTDQYKFTTYKAAFGNNVFSELGVYEFDTLQLKWRDNWVEKYNLDYDYVNKHVRQFEMKRGLTDTLQNMTSRTRYTFDSIHRVDTEYFEILKGGKYEISSTAFFKYNALSQINESVKVFNTGFYIQTFYTYDQQGRLANELMLNKFLSGPLDSNMRKTYTYDTAGRIVSNKTETYKINGSPYIWTTSQNNTYQYNQKGQVTGSTIWIYDYTQNYIQVPLNSFVYTYTPTGKMESSLQIDYVSGNVADKMMYTIDYDVTDDATEALAYTWNGAGYNLLPSYRFIFKQVPISGIAKTGKPEQMQIYPNPSKGLLYFMNYKPEHAKVFDMNGKMVIQVDDTDTLDLSGLAAGVYLLIADEQKPVKVVRG